MTKIIIYIVAGLILTATITISVYIDGLKKEIISHKNAIVVLEYDLLSAKSAFDTQSKAIVDMQIDKDAKLLTAIEANKKLDKKYQLALKQSKQVVKLDNSCEATLNAVYEAQVRYLYE